MRQAFFGVAFAAGLFFACSSSSTPSGGAPGDGVDAAAPGEDAAVETDASDAAAPVDASKPTGQCAATFGDKLTEGFGRIDGIVYAVQKPSDTQCVFPNNDHVIIQVLMNGAVYRLVANVQGSGTDPKIRIGQMAHALPAPAFAEGWHADAPLDYLTTLGAHADASFTALTLDEGVTKVAAALKIGDPVAIYGTCGAGRPESAHLIHRNKTNQDGAIVVNPTTTPTFMLFHFDNQTF
ncbi:MAG TPA: hypothetical protein VLT33_06715 [Labilithrix sp.]|nr:hypothetical protein [Labilithrix sp.]